MFFSAAIPYQQWYLKWNLKWTRCSLLKINFVGCYTLVFSLKCPYDVSLLILGSLNVKPTVSHFIGTWLNDLVHKYSILFQGFSKLITKNRRTRGGSTGLFVSEWPSTVIEDSAAETMESLKVSFFFENIKFGILNICRPPISSCRFRWVFRLINVIGSWQ